MTKSRIGHPTRRSDGRDTKSSVLTNPARTLFSDFWPSSQLAFLFNLKHCVHTNLRLSFSDPLHVPMYHQRLVILERSYHFHLDTFHRFLCDGLLGVRRMHEVPLWFSNQRCLGMEMWDLIFKRGMCLQSNARTDPILHFYLLKYWFIPQNLTHRSQDSLQQN